MEFITNAIASIAGSAGSQAAGSLLEQLMEPQDELTVDQLVALGLLKSQDDLIPAIDSELADMMASFAEDFETLRFQGFSNPEARDVVRFIYAPRIYLISGNHLPNDHVLDLDDEQIGKIVDNALLNFLETKGVDPSRDLNYLVAGVDDLLLSMDDEVFKNYIH